MWSQNFEKNREFGHKLTLNKKKFFKAHFLLVLHWGSVFKCFFLCFIFELSTERKKKMRQNCFKNVVSKY